VDAAPLFVQRVGDSGEPVVFLHGLFGQGKNFTSVAKALAPELRSLLVDLPNHGRSPWTGTTDWYAAADAVAATVRAEVDGRVHLVGHSMGGKVAMVLALRHPELVDRLVVVDISPAPSGGEGEFVHLLSSLQRLDLTAITRRGEADVQLAGDVPDERVRGFLLQNLRTGPDGWHWQADLALLLRELPTIAGWPDVDGTFDGPVLWMAGDRSPYVQPEHAAPMRALFPRTLLVTVKGAGHWVHSEQPAAFTSALRTFLLAD
jgi:pimeloyl-ACP methyl ester carboxylesterase